MKEKMRVLLVAQLAISCASATLSSADQKEILDATHDNRRFSHLENHLAPYNGEAPISAGLVGSTMLLGIFSTNGAAYKHELYSNRRKNIRETYLAIDDDRICKLEEFKRQLGINPQLRRCKIPYTFVIGAGGSDRPYDHNDDEPLTLNADQVDDADDEGDCTYLNIRQVRFFTLLSERIASRLMYLIHIRFAVYCQEYGRREEHDLYEVWNHSSR